VHYYSDDNDSWGGHGPMDTKTTVDFIKLYCKTNLPSYDSEVDLLQSNDESESKNDDSNKFHERIMKLIKGH
jgi:hypothetical protein